MSVEENKAVARRVYELLDERNVEALKSLTDAGFIDHNPMPGQAPGVEGEIEIVAMFTHAFPDFTHRVEDQLADEDRVMTRYTWRGTHRGEFAGIAPTGKRVEVSGIEVFRVRNGKIAEVWRCEDNLSLLQQLGVVPEFAKGEAGR